MAYRMLLASRATCPPKRLGHSSCCNCGPICVYLFFVCTKLCSHVRATVHQVLTYIKHFASFHNETILFPERNTLHAYYTHTRRRATCHCSFDVRYDGVAHIFYNTVAFHLMFYMYLLFVAIVAGAADAIRSLTVCVLCLLSWIYVHFAQCARVCMCVRHLDGQP